MKIEEKAGFFCLCHNFILYAKIETDYFYVEIDRSIRIKN